MSVQYLKNPKLQTIRTDWQGNPYYKKRFRYPEDSFKPEWNNFFKWMRQGNPQRKEKNRDQWRPVIHQGLDWLSRKDDFLIWMGHASFIIQLEGIRLLIDPVFFKLPLVARFVYLPYPVKLIKDLDYILISHDHRDHCDEKTIKTLLRNNQPKKILTSLNMSTVIRNWVNGTPIEEAGWYQTFETEKVRITYLPSMHWCRRGLNDFNYQLWGSFMIEGGGKTIYFGADSGPGKHFAEVGNLFPSIDIAILGIGAYKPAYMMQKIHTSPIQAKEAFDQLGAKKMIPMHYGTMDLSNEPISEPYHHIQHLFAESEEKDRLVLLGVNEVFSLM